MGFTVNLKRTESGIRKPSGMGKITKKQKQKITKSCALLIYVKCLLQGSIGNVLVIATNGRVAYI